MIYRQQRRDLAAQPAPPPATTGPDASETTDASLTTEAPTERAPDAPTVPPQHGHPRRDAYDLYAQIYAIRTEDRTT